MGNGGDELMLRISKQRLRVPREGQGDMPRGDPPDVASHLKRIRQQRGYSLETLARLSGVSRAMLGQIETGKSAPTIPLLWKVANALGVALSALIEDAATAPRCTILRRNALRGTALSDGKVQVLGYALPGRPLQFEATQLRLAAGHTETFPALCAKTVALLIVNAGIISVHADGMAPEVLEKDDAILFEAGQAYALSNSSAAEAILYLLVSTSWHGRIT